MHVLCVCVCMCVRVTRTVDNFYVCIACLCPLCETGRLLVCFFCLSVNVRLAPVVRLHDSRYSYGVLLCADAWPVWDGVSGISVRYDCVRARVVKLWTSTVRVSDAQLASTGDVAQCTRCTFSSSGYLVLSGFSI